MREPNMSLPSQNRAAVCITSALYDRRALDCTATLPMINSLTHLAYLTSTSPRIREILVLDGGLEQLVRILSNQDYRQQQPNHIPSSSTTTTSPHDLRMLCQWSLAFQCVVNIGVRGTEQIRTRVVEAGMIDIVLKVFQSFLQALEAVTGENEQKQHQQQHQQQQQQQMETKLFTMDRRGSELGGLQLEPTNEDDACRSQPHTHHQQQLPENNKPTPARLCSSSSSASMHPLPTYRQTKSPVHRRTTLPYMKISAEQRRRNRRHGSHRPTNPQNSSSSSPTSSASTSSSSVAVNMCYREEDILMSLQLLAYLSKYPHIRQLFYTNYNVNVFSVVEKFTFRAHPHLIQYWAGVIMRNACRKDETQGGIRRCANMRCGKWEKKPREFAKCRRCRKAKYCSKACQSVAWNDGHRWWCVERPSSSATAAANANSNATTHGHPLPHPTTTTHTTPNTTTTHPHHHQHSPTTAPSPSQQPSSISTLTTTIPSAEQQQPQEPMHH